MKASVAFLFSHKGSYPPDFENMKVYYVSMELVRQKIPVKWILIGNEQQDKRADGIEVLSLGSSHVPVIWRYMNVLRVC